MMAQDDQYRLKPIARVYIGNIESYLLSLIYSARHRLLLVSPWITPRYAQIALQKQREGVPTVIITSNKKEKWHRAALYMLLERERPKSCWQRVFPFRRKLVSKVNALLIADRLHAKVYVADNTAIIGSINLTGSQNIEAIVFLDNVDDILQQIEDELINTRVAVYYKEAK